MIILFLFLSYWLGLSWRYSWIIFAIIALAMFAFLWWRFSKKIAIICSCVFLIGFGTSLIRFSFNQKTYTGLVTESKENYFIFSSKLERLYVYEKGNSYEIGDILEIKGEKTELDISALESAYDFEHYLNTKGVYKKLIPTNINVKFSNLIRIKAYRNWFLSHFDDSSRGLVSSILFSVHMDNQITDSMEDLHLGRLMSASGIYVYAFIYILGFIFKRFIKDKWADLLVLGIIAAYGLFTFPRFAILKILLIILFKWINTYKFNKRFKYIEIIGLTGLLCLFFDYHLAYQDGFILGYIIPIVYVLSAPIFEDYKKIIRKILLAGFMYLFFIPFELKFYNSIAPASFINQIIFAPYFIVIAVLGFFSLCGIPIYKLIDWLVYPLIWIFKPFSTVNFAIYSPPMNEWMTLIYYLIFVAIIYLLTIKFKPFYKYVFTSYVLLLCFYFAPVQNLITNSVSFINVGQGDSCLIRSQNKTILIDTGGLKYMDLAKESLIPYFKKLRLYKIDYVITTHDDSDHSGALSSLQTNFKVGKYLNSYQSFPFTYAGITFTNYNNHIDDSKDENGKSLVVGFHFMKKDFLIMGDAPKEIEYKMMKEYSSIPCDILKVGHHGSSTSTSDSFIKYLKPKEAVISVGKNNSYGHPESSVLMILKYNKVVIKRTDILGTITYSNYIFM